MTRHLYVHISLSQQITKADGPIGQPLKGFFPIFTLSPPLQPEEAKKRIAGGGDAEIRWPRWSRWRPKAEKPNAAAAASRGRGVVWKMVVIRNSRKPFDRVWNFQNMRGKLFVLCGIIHVKCV